MRQYLELMRHVLEHGAGKTDRTGTGTRATFGWQMRFDLRHGFPLVTTKKLHLKSIVHELLWFLRGETNVRYLREHGVTIWDEWADAAGELGPVYGVQWRSWRGADGRTHDQIRSALDLLKRDPHSRRIIVNAWNVGEPKWNSCGSATILASPMLEKSVRPVRAAMTVPTTRPMRIAASSAPGMLPNPPRATTTKAMRLKSEPTSGYTAR